MRAEPIRGEASLAAALEAHARQTRLATAPRWLAGYGGKHVVKRYARWYGVDLLCAIKELRLLGVQVVHE